MSLITLSDIDVLAYSHRIEVEISEKTMVIFVTITKGSIFHKFNFIKELNEGKRLGVIVDYGRDNWISDIMNWYLHRRLYKRRWCKR